MSTPKPLLWITVFGLGHLRPAPGTWGSLPSAILASGLILANLGPWQSPVVYAGMMSLVVVVFSAACILQGPRAEETFGRKDPSEVVADETAGQALALIWLPAAAAGSIWMGLFAVGAGFVAFRLFDILKPWPAHGLQRIPGGFGILIDDLIAGLYALCTVFAGFWLWSRYVVSENFGN